MSKKNKTYSVAEKKKNSNSITLKGGYISVKMDNIHEHFEETKRGCGVHASKKTYNRKKSNRISNNYDCSYFFRKISYYIFVQPVALSI